MHHRRLLLGAATSGVLALAGAGSAQAETLAPYHGGQVAQYGGVQVWSQPNANSDSWTLMKRVNGAITQVGVAAQPSAFPVTAGTDGDGHVRVIFATCPTDDGGEPSDCTLNELDPYSGAVRSLAAETHEPGGSETAPGLDNGILTFGRVSPSGTRRILIRRLGSGRPSRALVRTRERMRITGTTTSPTGVAYTTWNRSESVRETRLSFIAAGTTTPRLIARGGVGEENFRAHHSPRLAGSTLYWGWANFSPSQRANGYALRCRIGSGGRGESATLPGFLSSVSVDAANPGAPLLASSYAEESSREGSNAVYTETPTWTAPPPPITGVRGC